MTTAKPKRRSFRFSLRALLVCVMVLSAPLAWFAWKLDEAKRQRKAVQAIVEAGGRVNYDYQLREDGEHLFYPTPEPTTPAWLRKVLGDDFFCDVGAVNYDTMFGPEGVPYSDPQVTNDDLKSLRDLVGLKRVILDGTGISDDGLEHLTCLTSLRLVSLYDTQVTDEGVKKLQEALPNCKILH